MIAGQEFSCTCYTGLYFVGNKKNIVFLAQIICFRKVSCIRHKYAGFALYRFNKETCNIFVSKCIFECSKVVVRNGYKTGSERPKSCIRIRIGRHGYNSYSAAMEITFTNNNLSFSIFNTFHLISPFTAKFQRSFISFSPRIHRKHLIIAKIFGNVFFVQT